MPAGSLVYTVDVYNIYSLARSLTVQRPSDSISPALDLMRHGYLAKSPTKPTVAVSISTLELLYRLRQRKASFSIEAFAKVVCDFYNMPYRRHLREIFSDTFEIYLRIVRGIRKKVHQTLGWDGTDWRVQNACPACCYSLDDEPSLQFSRLLAMDGNNSLKRMAVNAQRIAADTRELDDSDYFLSRSFVNRFANEVRGRGTKGPRVRHDGDGSDDEIYEDYSGPLKLALCVRNWKSAAQESNKKMWAMFEESGIFASACRHGSILWIADMVCSGELAKYPLAIVAKALESLDPKLLIGYDIGCSFQTTVSTTSLGSAFTTSESRFCVCAFHAYSHCHTCQLQYHPNIVPGAGLEDLETMERVFSAMNELASVTRYASPYRRHLFMEAYLRQWDEDKYLNLGTFILNNYKQALEIVHQDSAALSEAMISLDISNDDLDQFEKEEAEFFSQAGTEDPHDLRAVAYVERLQELSNLEPTRAQANARFISYAPSGPDYNYSYELAATRRLETERRHANERYDRVYGDVCALELEMGISIRWTPSTPEYIEAVKYMKERKYHRAIAKLQKLVTQRLFELQKLNVAQTGYKMRTHISKSLKTRCTAIQSALATYNAAAAALDPPRPPLDWAKVGGYQFLEEFALLQDTRNDVRQKRWAESAVRSAIKQRHRIRRAYEEIQRLNVETRRLHTSIRDQYALFEATRARLKAANDPLLGAVEDFMERRENINLQLLRRVQEIYSLPGYTGCKSCGFRHGTRPTDAGSLSDGLTPSRVPDSDDPDDNVDVLEGDEEQQALGNVLEFISSLGMT
ncbi:hypothetical protein BDY19DRAFT_899813 [Irpex rosettiformis]|uniref:Uncharacterized protein n=1 Tax=Irpex rosettiformis TaxID=378272 RepID=A0ACB8TP11_9APHY|nr:hypothetical protein BDY19DRAFT_899813 [Irpex rosettiformis]